MVSAIIVSIYSPSQFDAISGAVGILFVHDLDEQIYSAVNGIHSNLKKIIAIITWTFLSIVIASTTACVYTNNKWFADDSHICLDSEYQCNNGECVWYGYLCNGQSDCRDGSDEGINKCDYSLISCPEDTFMCRNSGQCIDIIHRCDGIKDCNDGSDEDRYQNCASLYAEIRCNDGNGHPVFEQKYENDSWFLSVSNGYYKCNNGQCIDVQFMCDGVLNDCLDGSDEYPYFEQGINQWPFLKNCPYSRLIECKSDQVLCKINGKCISKIRICDGFNDCPDGQDEFACDRIHSFIGACGGYPNVDLFECGGPIAAILDDTFILFENETVINYNTKEDILLFLSNSTVYPIDVLTSGQCIPWHYRCDGIVDCKDGSDEQLCEYFGCKEDEYQCSDGKCIPLKWQCDEYKDCADGDDEMQCNYQQETGVFNQSILCNEYAVGTLTKETILYEYTIFIPCPYVAVQFTTCLNGTFELDTIMFAVNENFQRWYNDDASRNGRCDMNSLAAMITINSDEFECDTSYAVRRQRIFRLWLSDW